MSDLKVLFEDNHLLVVNKPALLPTMGVADGDESLHSLACAYLKDKYQKRGNVYLGIVHRIDSFVSGTIVLARTSKAASRLSDQFRRRTVDKKYWAIVPDHCPDEGQLTDHLAKNETRKRMEVVTQGNPKFKASKEAKLSFRTLGKHSGFKLIEVVLETGRKHQIRVQFENLGCPIIGDRKYGSELKFAKGIALHSNTMTLVHPTKKVIQSFQSNPPEWWNLRRFSI
ncbi:MAG: RluA family pseudouridine synthase [Planctomycetota bacterium]